MTMTETQRAAELAARFATSKQETEQAAQRVQRDGAAERKAIVNELLTLMPAPAVAELLGVTLARVGQIVGGVRK